jgi:hypothetical protein
MDSESNIIPFISKEMDAHIEKTCNYLNLQNGVSINWLNSNPDSGKDTEDIYKKYKEFYDKNIINPAIQTEVTAHELIKFVLMNPSLANFFGIYIDPETFDMNGEVDKESIDEDLEIGHVINATDPEIWKNKKNNISP